MLLAVICAAQVVLCCDIDGPAALHTAQLNYKLLILYTTIYLFINEIRYIFQPKYITVIRLIIPKASYITPCVLCIMYYVLCIMYYVLCIMYS
jgi:hypothetical protein